MLFYLKKKTFAEQFNLGSLKDKKSCYATFRYGLSSALQSDKIPTQFN